MNVERFLSKVNRVEDCWLWTGDIQQDGYGRFEHRNKAYMAHRWIYEQLVGSIGIGLEIDHLCRQRRCVNPEHLQPVVHAENARRRAAIVCKNGHPFTAANTCWRTKGIQRQCRQCNREAVARYQAKKRVFA